jgi:hypothetical protein
MDSISDTAIELQQAVRQALAIIATVSSDHRTTVTTSSSSPRNGDEEDVHEDNSSIIKYKKYTNTFERKRCLRRIERAVYAFYKQLCLFRENREDDEEDAEDFAAAQAVLDNETLESLMDIITELPKLDNFVKSSTFEEIYSEIISLVCSVIQQYGITSINPNQIDRLLDRVATLALQEQVDVDVLQLLNAALLYRMQMSSADRLPEQQHHSPPDATSWGAAAELNEDDIDRTNEGYSDVSFSQLDKSRAASKEEESAIILNAIETIRLTQLLIPLSLRFFSHPWAFLSQEAGEHHNELGHGSNQHSQANWSEQHGGLQLRILLHYLLEHLIHKVVESNPEESQDDKWNLDKLDRFLLHLFHQEIRSRSELDGSSYGHHNQRELELEAVAAEEAKEMVEDYIDLLTSFVVENIEFAIDAIDSSSHVLGQFVRVNPKGDSMYRKSESDNCLIYRYFKDAVRLCSLACGLIELFGVLYDSFESHAKKLLETYVTFVAFYCNDDFVADVDSAGGVSIDFADNVLLRLYTCTENSFHSNIHGGKGSMFAEASRNRSKRRRIHVASSSCFAKMTSMKETTIATFLRAFYQSFVKNDKIAMDLLALELQKAKDLIRNNQGGTEHESFIQEYSTLVQACALSVLKSPDQFKAELFSLLMNLLISVDGSEPDGETREKMHLSNQSNLDVTNPWNFLICRSLLEKIEHTSNQNAESSLAMRSATVSISSTVSDVRSNNTSSSGRQMGRIGGQRSNEKIFDELSLLFSTFPDPINTLLA